MRYLCGEAGGRGDGECVKRLSRSILRQVMGSLFLIKIMTNMQGEGQRGRRKINWQMVVTYATE